MHDIVTTICGNVATEPKVTNTAAGQTVVSFRLACTPRRFDRELQGYVDKATTWVNVSCWGGLALNVARSMRKGLPVVAFGSVEVREWQTEDGRSGKELEMRAFTVGHDLRRGYAEFAKVGRPVREQAERPVDAERAGESAPGRRPGSVDDLEEDLDDDVRDLDDVDELDGDEPEHEHEAGELLAPA